MRRATDEVAAFAARPVYGLSDQSLCDAAVAAHELVSRATAVLGLLVREAHGRDLPHRQDATSTVAWLRDLLRITPAEARQLVTLGETLDGRPTLADAVLTGAVTTGHATAIGRVLTDVPAGEPGLVDKVEAILIEQAHQFEPTILRQLGQRVIAHLNPDLADARLRDRLDREDQHARQRRGLTLASDGLGAPASPASSTPKPPPSSAPPSNPSPNPPAATTAPTCAQRPPAAPTPSSRCADSRFNPAAYPTPVNHRS